MLSQSALELVYGAADQPGSPGEFISYAAWFVVLLELITSERLRPLLRVQRASAGSKQLADGKTSTHLDELQAHDHSQPSTQAFCVADRP